MTQAAVAARTTTRARIPHPARWLFVVVGVVGLVGYAVPVLRRLRYPYELSFFEGSTVEVSGRLVDGLALYGPPSAEFTPWPYPPMYFWVTSVAADLMGLSLPTMRVVSVIASVAVLALVGLVVNRMTSSSAAALLGMGLYAATYRVSGAWADTARVDSLFLALVMAVLVVAMRARTPTGGLVVGALVVAAFLTKQNALIAAAPVLLVLLLRRRRVGVIASSVAVIGSMGSVLIGDASTRGWYSPYVVAQLLGHDTRFAWLVYLPVVDVVLPFALIVATLGLLALRHRAAWSERRPTGMTDDAAVVAAGIVGLLLAGLAGRLHDGGSSNVAMPTHLATAIVLAIALARVAGSGVLTRGELWMAGGAAVAQVLVLQVWLTGIVPTPTDRAAGDQFIAELAAQPSPAIVTSHPYYARLAGQSPAVSTIAVTDLLDTRSSRARTALVGQLPWSLAGVSAVVVDNDATSFLFGTDLADDFTLVSDDAVPGDAFVPVTDFPVKPRWVYVRTSELTP
ncbi:MAG: glycosyltransferase family 39 protein [Candidatus Nanopelagicales bacterium]